MLLITHCKIEPASLENILVKNIFFFEIITCSCIKNLLEFVTISYKVVNELSTWKGGLSCGLKLAVLSNLIFLFILGIGLDDSKNMACNESYCNLF